MFHGNLNPHLILLLLGKVYKVDSQSLSEMSVFTPAELIKPPHPGARLVEPAPFTLNSST